MPEKELSISNIVASGDLGVELNLEAVERDISVPYTKYDPSKYHGLYVRLAKDGPLVTIYRSGKYIIVGCSSLNELNEMNQRFLTSMAELDILSESSDTGFEIQNIVCTGDLQQDVNLNALSIGLGLESVEYEPEQFSGLVYRPEKFSTVLLIFSNGRVVVTGATGIEMAKSAFEYLQSKTESILES